MYMRRYGIIPTARIRHSVQRKTATDATLKELKILCKKYKIKVQNKILNNALTFFFITKNYFVAL